MINIELLEPYVKFNVLSLKSLSEGNYPLHLYVKDNLDYISKSTGLEILDESQAIRGTRILRNYLRYYYGETVNITKVRADNASIYNNICAIGNPEDVVSDMGFTVEYTRKITMDELKSELDALLVNGLVGKIPKRLYNKLWYEGGKRNMTAIEYMTSIGYTSSYGAEEFIDKSRTELMSIDKSRKSKR